MAEDRFDGLFLNVAQQSQGIEPLLDNLFSFLRRKTDFFVGASQSQVEETVMKAVKKHSEISAKEEKEKKKRREKEELKKKELAEKKKKEEAAKKDAEAAAAAAASATKAAPVEDGVLELNDDGTFDTSTATSTPRSVNDVKLDETSAKDLANAPLTEEEENKKAEEEEEDNTPPPPGNGGTVEGKYTWTQTLSDLMVFIKLPPGTKSKMLDITFTNSKYKVAIKGQNVLVEGEWHKRIIVDDTFWTLEDGDLVFNIQKDDKMNWWKCVTVGDPEINTQKVQPENSKLSDLDGETRQTVEKMMFDQRQKAAGLPSSDELQKQEMLQKFMAQHPEMDFSNAKFS